jgi:hypothetical protein
VHFGSPEHKEEWVKDLGKTMSPVKSVFSPFPTDEVYSVVFFLSFFM